MPIALPGGRVRSYRDDGAGGFTDEAAAWGLVSVYRGNGSAVGDYDNDGDLDIFVNSAGDVSDAVNASQHKLWQNQSAQGSNMFVDSAVTAGVNHTSATSFFPFGAAWGDYDLDGDLDLFVSAWAPQSETTDGNRLFQNEGGTFTDVTVEAGLSAMAVNTHGFGARFADMNGDRYPELLYVSDFGQSKYFSNKGDGTFEDKTGTAGTGLDRNGMGSAVGDFNRDGRLDWYVTSIYSGGGGALSGNFLYVNRGGDVFTPLSGADGAKDGGWGWGTAVSDIDHNGWPDILETNGWPAAEWQNEPAYAFRNNGNLTFDEVHAEIGLNHTLQGRALVTLDADLDGDMDVIISSNDATAANTNALQYYRNDLCSTGGGCPATGTYLTVKLDTAGTALAPDGYGAMVRVVVGGQSQFVPMVGGSNFVGQGELLAHFGLGDASSVDRVVVLWPDGSATAVENVAANQRLILSPPTFFEPAVSIAPKALSRLEGNAGQTTVEFTVSLAAVVPHSVLVFYETVDGTAEFGSDYVHVASSVMIPADTASASFDVTFNGDITFEGDESFFVKLTSATDAALWDDVATVTILTDDGVLLADGFNDTLDGWTTSGRGSWSLAAGELIGTTSGALRVDADAPWSPSGAFDCLICTIEAVAQITSGTTKSSVSVFGWFLDRRNYVEVRMEKKGQWRLLQRVAGKLVKGVRFKRTVESGRPYAVSVSFDGTDFSLIVDGEVLVTVPATGGSDRAGGVRLQVRRATAAFDYVRVY